MNLAKLAATSVVLAIVPFFGKAGQLVQRMRRLPSNAESTIISFRVLNAFGSLG
jgi:hypothetical protein